MDHPLSLVLGHHQNREREHHLIHNKTPPPPLPRDHQQQHVEAQNFGSSSGYSSPEHLEHHGDKIVHVQAEEESDEQPLSLVMAKKDDSIAIRDDSGHDTTTDGENSRSSPISEEQESKGANSIPIKIKEFAKFNLGEDARDKVPKHMEQTLLAALTAPPKVRPPPPNFAGAPSIPSSQLPPPPPALCPPGGEPIVGQQQQLDETMSEVSSIDTWTTR